MGHWPAWWMHSGLTGRHKRSKLLITCGHDIGPVTVHSNYHVPDLVSISLYVLLMSQDRNVLRMRACHTSILGQHK